jgi:hypothetical protein
MGEMIKYFSIFLSAYVKIANLVLGFRLWALGL